MHGCQLVFGYEDEDREVPANVKYLLKFLEAMKTSLNFTFATNNIKASYANVN